MEDTTLKLELPAKKTTKLRPHMVFGMYVNHNKNLSLRSALTSNYLIHHLVKVNSLPVNSIKYSGSK